jgi:hypothetical protein
MQFALKNDLVAEQAMRRCILCASRLAFVGARAGGELCVATIGVELLLRDRHDALLMGCENGSARAVEIFVSRVFQPVRV